MTIKSITPYQILDSRGEPTLLVSMVSDENIEVKFAVPAGSSLGKEEAVEKRDGEGPFNGKGVLGCIDLINNTIAPKFLGYPLNQQQDFDSLLIALDGSERKQNLGANTLLALSGAYLKLSAKVKNQPLWQYIAEHNQTSPEFPRLFASIVGGGKHAPGLDIQEYLIVPQNNRPSAAISAIYDTYHTTKKIMQGLYGPSSSLVGDEGGLAPIGTNSEVILETLSGINSKSTEKFDISLDAAANSFYKDGLYNIEAQRLHSSDLFKIYQDWNTKFNIMSIEDPFAEDDLEGTEIIKGLKTQGQNKPFLVFADDFTVSNKAKIELMQKDELFDGIIIKPNQVGTFSETFDAIAAAKATKAKVIISQRSGETTDTLIADLAYGVGAMGLKLGAPMRGERVVKYNRLLQIEADLDSNQLKASASNVVSAPVAIEKSGPTANRPIDSPPQVKFTPPISPISSTSSTISTAPNTSTEIPELSQKPAQPIRSSADKVIINNTGQANNQPDKMEDISRSTPTTTAPPAPAPTPTSAPSPAQAPKEDISSKQPSIIPPLTGSDNTNSNTNPNIPTLST